MLILFSVLSQSAERRGIGINRALHALLEFCHVQLGDAVKKQNQYVLKEP